MKIKKKVILYTDIDVEITGITLLSAEEYKMFRRYIPQINTFWWLRSPGSDCGFAARVRPDGSVDDFGGIVFFIYPVRPALLLKAENLLIGDEFIFGGKKWVYLNNGLAIAKELFDDILPFRENWQAENANDYEASDVKVFLDEWLKEAEKNG